MELTEITEYNAEIDVLIEVLYQQMLDINAEKDRSSIESAIKNALKPESRAMFFLAKDNNIPIGLAFINICSGIESGGDYVWINEIQIIPQFRGKGFGSDLLRCIMQWSKNNNMKAILCVADIKNSVSQSFFKSAGFTVEDIKWMKKI